MTATSATCALDAALVQARWAWMHCEWAGDFVELEVVARRIDELLDARWALVHPVEPVV